MTKRRVLAIGLDGFDISLGEAMMAKGGLPNLARLRADGLSVMLDHGAARNSALAWEQVSTGQSPFDGGRESAVRFDPARYVVTQELTSARPLFEDVKAKTVVFDTPYFDLAKAPSVRGLTNWGAHDPGVAGASRPDGLAEEILERFGPYPATPWIYGFTWPSVAKTRESGEALTRAVEKRSAIARWLLADRLPDWELAVVVVSEAHSAMEIHWHGVDPEHPLHALPSASASATAVDSVYQAIDRLIGALRFSDTITVAFAMHGMGRNEADVAAMLLLPELLYRHAFGHAYMRERPWVGRLPSGVPLLAENDSWEAVMGEIVPGRHRSLLERALRRLGLARPTDDGNLDWMPADRYRRFWPKMPAFALPAFYDGRIRINLRGREAEGMVSAADYPTVCNDLVTLLMECRDPLTGEAAVRSVNISSNDPFAVKAEQGDLSVHWKGAPLGLTHPKLGTIGPVPFRRTGGHTGGSGFFTAAGPGVKPGVGAERSSFDVVPTLLDLLGETSATAPSGSPIDLVGSGGALPATRVPAE